jgi:uncharacterized protein (TIGR02246 family)
VGEAREAGEAREVEAGQGEKAVTLPRFVFAINVLLEVRGQPDKARVVLHTLPEIHDFEVGVSIQISGCRRVLVQRLPKPTYPSRIMSDTDETVIRELVTNWAAAVRAHDLPGILAHHAPDILMFDVPPPVVLRGIDAYRKTWDLFYRYNPDPVVFDIDELNVVAGSDAAFATALMHCNNTDPDRSRNRLDFRLTVGLRKLDGRWTVVHEHHSIPAE